MCCPQATLLLSPQAYLILLLGPPNVLPTPPTIHGYSISTVCEILKDLAYATPWTLIDPLDATQRLVLIEGQEATSIPAQLV